MSYSLKKFLLRDLEGSINMTSGINKNLIAIREKVSEADEKVDIGYLEIMAKDISNLSKELSRIYW